MAKIPKCGRLSIGQLSVVNFQAHYKIVGLHFFTLLCSRLTALGYGAI